MTMLYMYAVSITPHGTLHKFDYLKNYLFHGFIAMLLKLLYHQRKLKIMDLALIINTCNKYYMLWTKVETQVIVCDWSKLERVST